jgi:hypothetical protein
MELTLTNLSSNIKPAPNTSLARRAVCWSGMTNENLKFTYDLLCLHQSPFEVDAMNEITKRIVAGTWLDLDAPPPLLHSVPKWLIVFPFSLLWHQKRGHNSVGEGSE